MGQERGTEILFGGVSDGQRTVVVNGITFNVPEEQIQALLDGADNNPDAPLSVMPDGRPCVTWVPTGQVKFTLSLDDLEAALAELGKHCPVPQSV